jgi:tryptophan-rich sensory protein
MTQEEVFFVSRQFIGLFGWIALTGVAAATGAMASIDATSFYAQLSRPGWAPSGSVFSPVWTVLYLLMAVAAWLVWREAASAKRTLALMWYVIQLVLNALWSVLFFRERLVLWALTDLLALWLLIVATFAAFWRIRRLAAALLVPYLLWVSFAGVLNYSVWERNPDLL